MYTPPKKTEGNRLIKQWVRPQLNLLKQWVRLPILHLLLGAKTVEQRMVLMLPASTLFTPRIVTCTQKDVYPPPKTEGNRLIKQWVRLLLNLLKQWVRPPIPQMLLGTKTVEQRMVLMYPAPTLYSCYCFKVLLIR